MDYFSKSHDKFWQEISAKDPVKLAESVGVIYKEAEKIFKVKVIDDTCKVDSENRTMQFESLPGEPPFETKLIIVTYLSLASSQECSGEWVTEQLLPSGNVFFRGLHSLPAQKVIDCYKNDLSSLKKKCFQLGGKEIRSNSDFGVEFRLLPKFPLRMLCWKSDEEFPARVSFFFDKFADKFLYLDGIGALVNLLINKLIK